MNGKTDTITSGSDVLIVLNRKKRWLRKVKAGEKFQCHKGYFEYNDIIVKPYGTTIVTNKSVKLTILKPIASDFLTQISHSSQIIYPKDAGLILLYGGVVPGSKVIEAGTGSGALTSILATYVAPMGHIYTYERREQAYKTATQNIKRLGLEEHITFYNKDVADGFYETEVDAVVLDLGDPWEIIPAAYNALKCGGTISIFIPTYNQIDKVSRVLHKYFCDVFAIELIEREIQIKESAIRPKTWMVGHTGFLVFGRKLSEENKKEIRED